MHARFRGLASLSSALANLQSKIHVSETKTEPAALLYGRGQNSTAASSPAVTSSRRDLRDLAHRLSHLVGPIVDGKDDGGGNGGAARRDDGDTPATTSAAQPKVRTSTRVLRRT